MTRFRVLIPLCGVFPLREAFPDMGAAALAVCHALEADLADPLPQEACGATGRQHERVPRFLDMLDIGPLCREVADSRLILAPHGREVPAAREWFVRGGEVYERALSARDAGFPDRALVEVLF